MAKVDVDALIAKLPSERQQKINATAAAINVARAEARKNEHKIAATGAARMNRIPAHA